jgi:DNA invertase Pin-like site-specific DNA recombinase
MRDWLAATLWIDEQRMIYFYGRVSTDHQENSSSNQRESFEKLGAEWGQDYRIFIDEDVSGSIELRMRPKGKEMWDALRPGDTLVVTRLDRGWRNIEDAAHTLRVMRELGVKVHIMDSPIDPSTDEGELMFIMCASFAQYERKLKARRIADVCQYRRRNGMPYSCFRPYGWKRKGDTFVPCKEERAIADMVTELREEGMSWRGIAAWLCRNGYRRPSQTYTRTKTGYYDHRHVSDLVLARAAGYPKVRQAALRSGELSGKSA